MYRITIDEATRELLSPLNELVQDIMESFEADIVLQPSRNSLPMSHCLKYPRAN